MSITHLDDHVEAGLELPIDYFKDKPRLAALLTSFLAQVQDLEDATWSVIIGRLIDTAEGVQLDTLGRIVGQKRLEAADDLYRLRIRTRIRALRSRGTARDVIEVAMMASGSAPDRIIYEEHYPASIVVETLDAVEGDVEDYTDLAILVNEYIQMAKAAGVQASYHYSTWSDDADTFTFAEGDDPEDDEERGFSGDDPEVGPGGVFIGSFS